MVEGLIGKKIGMTRTFDEEGNVVPVTVIKAGPCTVIQKKSKEKDGYSSIQLGFVEEKGLKRPTRPQVGHFEKSGLPPTKVLKEFRFDEQREIKEGDQFFVDIFEVGEKVHIVGTSKGKGFAGVVKRWGFRGGKASHGSMFHRRPGSVGASAFPSRVVKGKKLPGHMGSERVTVRNLTVVQADKDNNLLVVKGAIPGAPGGYLLIKKADFLFGPPKPVEVKPEKPKAEQPKADEAKAEQPRPEKPEPEQPEQALKPEQSKPEEPKRAKAKHKQAEPGQPEDEKPEKAEKTVQPEPEQLKPEEPQSEPGSHRPESAQEKEKE
ncbi:MAG: 50S ribosomal protein L3 [Candidatus Aminicenantes bacterium]|nr:MAG: 50S ribosomal protein L3 [Candidatus Aminicenantes bacterium]